MDTIIEDNIRLLEEGVRFLRAIPAELFARKQEHGLNACIGEHIRHNLDHYECFLRGIEGAFIDYDARVRDPLVESDQNHACTTMSALSERLGALTGTDLDTPVQVNMDSRGPAGEAGCQPSKSSLRRELQFLVSHTVHHYALIAVYCRLRGVDPGPTFGVAPSTLRFRAQEQERGSCAR